MRYERTRQDLDAARTYIVAADMTSGTKPNLRIRG
jgi:hypothetical protein